MNPVESARGRGPAWQAIRRKNFLSGLFFIGIAALGLWVSRNYPIGTAFRMGTGYVPRMLCWILLSLGVAILVQGLRAPEADMEHGTGLPLRPLIFVPAAILAFAFTIERLGIVIAAVLLIGIGSLAGREVRPLEVAIAAGVLVTLTLAIFIWGLGLPIAVWPER